PARVPVLHDVPHRPAAPRVVPRVAGARRSRQPDRGRRRYGGVGPGRTGADALDHVSDATTGRPRVSAVLTTRNSETYLAPQLASVVGHRRPVDEIVVGDDASTDGTRRLLTRLLPHDPSVTLHVVERDEQVGFRANVESTARLATGDIVC